jgi:hypothetical protein
VPRIQIQVGARGMKVLRDYNQARGQPRPERVDVPATVVEGGHVYTNVLLHLKGSWSYQPVDEKPSFTLKFDADHGGARFHGLEKVHMNNSGQDPSFLCEPMMRSLLNDLGVPCPRAGHAQVQLNGRELGVYVLVEGANRRFLKRHFAKVDGNLYDGGSGGDVTKALKVDSGDHPEDRSDLRALVDAAQERNHSLRMARLRQLLDLDRFVTLVATEVLFVHWDGYSMSANNYRVFHDTESGRMVFMAHGMDQLFGVSRSPEMSISPQMKGVVARGLVGVPEGRRLLQQRITQLFTNELRPEAVLRRVDKLAAPVRASLAEEGGARRVFDRNLRALRGRIQARMASVAAQIGEPEKPVEFAADGVLRLRDWQPRPGPQGRVLTQRIVEDGHEVLVVDAAPEATSGSWRKRVLLPAGHYTFTAQARTQGVPAAAKGAAENGGVLLRISGDRGASSGVVAPAWASLRYEFDLAAPDDVELICELRGRQGKGFFHADSLHLVRHSPPASLTPVVK